MLSLVRSAVTGYPWLVIAVIRAWILTHYCHVFVTQDLEQESISTIIANNNYQGISHSLTIATK